MASRTATKTVLAQKADGLQVGDKLLSVNDSEIKSAKLLNELLGKVPDGASVRFTWELREHSGRRVAK